MLINKYIIAGGEDFTKEVGTAGISPEAKKCFKQWKSEILTACDKNIEPMFFIPVSDNSRLLLKGLNQSRGSQRQIAWVLGIELEKKEYSDFVSYLSIVKGFKNISVNQIEKNYGSSGKPFECNFKFPQNTSSISKYFNELEGKDFKGDYPAVLDEFCSNISLNNIDDWFTKLFVAVNPVDYHSEFSCMIGRNLPARILVSNNKTNSNSTNSKLSNKSNIDNKKVDPIVPNKNNNISKIININPILVVVVILLLASNIFIISQYFKISKNCEALADRVKQQDINDNRISSLDSQIGKLNQDISDFKQKIKDLNNEIKNKELDIESLKTKNALLEERINDLKRENEGLNGLIDIKKSEINKLNESNNQLKKSNETSEKMIANYKKNEEENNKKIKEKDKKIEDYEKENKDLKKDIEKLQNQLQSKDKQNTN